MDLQFSLKGDLDMVALYAAVVATAVLIWDVVKWRRQGARLMLRVLPEMVILDDPSSKPFIFLKVTNIGDKPTELTHLVMLQWESRIHKFLYKKPNNEMLVQVWKPNHIGALPAKLGVGETWNGAVNRTEDVVALIQESAIYIGVMHTMAKKATTAHIGK